MEEILGADFSNSKTKDFLKKNINIDLFGCEEIKAYLDVTYLSYKKFGFGIMIKNSNNKIDSLFFYNENKKLGFNKFQGILPYGINISDLNSDIVKKFGEPSKKGGNFILKQELVSQYG
jgi:hypothetical protein